jgi:hypothetical protein
MTAIGFVPRLESTLAKGVGAVVSALCRRSVVNARLIATTPLRGITLVLPILLIVCIPLLLSQTVVLNNWYLDYSLPLDTSMRWAFGHLPHIDFETPIGIAYWLAQGWATELIGIDVRTPIVANFISVIPIAIGGLYLLWHKLPGGMLGLFMLPVILFVVSARAPGDVPGQTSFLASYNTVGMAMVCILATSVFLESAKPRQRAGAAIEAGIMAFFLLWLVYLKVSFVAIGLGAAIVSLHYAPDNRKPVILALLLAAAGVLVVGWATGLNGPYFDDLAAAAKASPTFRIKKLLFDTVSSRLSLMLVGLCMVYYWRLSSAERSKKISNFVVASGFLIAGLITTNQVHDNYLPFGFIALLILAQKASQEDGGAARVVGAYFPPLVGAFLLVGAQALHDVRSAAQYFAMGRGAELRTRMCDQPEIPVCHLAYEFAGASVRERLEPLPGPKFLDVAAREESTNSLPSLVELSEFCDADEDCLFWKLHEQSYQLLNRHIRRGDRPYFFGFTSILPYYYQLEPPKFVMAWSGIDRNFSQNSYPDAERMFSDTTLMVTPKVAFGTGREQGLHAIYEEEIPKYFKKVGETDAWIVWRRPDTRLAADVTE